MTTEEDYLRLGEAAANRRIALDRTQMEVAQLGGFSLDRVSAIERGEAHNLRAKTIRALERGLDWEAGSVRAILDGDEPIVREQRAPLGTATSVEEAQPIRPVKDETQWTPTSPLIGLPADPHERIAALTERIRIIGETLAATERAQGLGDRAAEDAEIAAMAHLPGPVRHALEEGEVEEWHLLDASEVGDDGMLLVAWVGPRPGPDEMKEIRRDAAAHRRRRLAVRDVVIAQQDAWEALIAAETEARAGQEKDNPDTDG